MHPLTSWLFICVQSFCCTHSKFNLCLWFSVYTVCCVQEPFQLTECVHIIYSLFASVFSDTLIAKLSFSNPECDYGVFWSLETIFKLQGKLQWCNITNPMLGNDQPHVCTTDHGRENVCDKWRKFFERDLNSVVNQQTVKIQKVMVIQLSSIIYLSSLQYKTPVMLELRLSSDKKGIQLITSFVIQRKHLKIFQCKLIFLNEWIN